MLIKSCNFCDACRNSIQRDRIESDVQEALLKQRNISLETNIDILYRAAERAKSQSKVIRPEAVNKVARPKQGILHRELRQSPHCQFQNGEELDKNLKMNHHANSVDSRIMTKEGAPQMDKPATFVEEQSTHNAKSRATMNTHGRCQKNYYK